MESRMTAGATTDYLDLSKAGTPKTPCWAELPAELWLKIFSHHAADIPGAFTCEDRDAINSYTRDEYAICLHRRYREAMDFKLAISLVCRSWNALATEFLFKYLLITSGCHAKRIASALGCDELPSGLEDTEGPGRWTVRVELALTGVHVWTNQHSRALAHIFNRCPNLAVFSMQFCTAPSQFCHIPSFATAFDRLASRPSLRRLELAGNLRFFDAVLALVSDSLEVLWLLPEKPSSTNGRGKMKARALTKLHTFVWSSPTRALESLTAWEMPALDTLVVTETHTEDSTYLSLFLSRHGAQLLNLVTPFWPPGLVELCPRLLAYEQSAGSGASIGIGDKIAHPSVWRLTVCPEVLRATLCVALPALVVVRVRLPVADAAAPDADYALTRLTIGATFLARLCIRVEACLGAYASTSDAWVVVTPEFLSSQTQTPVAALLRSGFPM